MSSGEGEAAMKDVDDKAMYDRLQKDMEVIRSEVAKLTDQLSGALNGVANTAQAQARRSYKQARANVDSIMSDASKHGQTALNAAQDAAATLEDSLEDAVQQRPLAAVGLAAGLGFLIGVTWRR